MANSDAFINLSDKLSEMQTELMQHNWPDEDRIEKAAAFRNELFDAIAAYRDWWIEHSQPLPIISYEDTHYNEMAEAEDEAKALEEEIEAENLSYYESITNPNRV